VVLLGGVGLGVLASAADATPPNDALGALPASDLAYARLLMGWELLTIDFYTHAVGSGHLDHVTGDAARLALSNEYAHYNYLAGVLAGAGQDALTTPDIVYVYPNGAFYTARSVLHLAVTLEHYSLGTCLGAGGNIANPALASAVAQIAANEAQHLSVLSLRSGAPAFRDAFPATMTMKVSKDALYDYAAYV
jgi:hypothetical protein